MVVFGHGRLTAIDAFRYRDEVLTVNNFKYLGVKISILSYFAKCKKNSLEKVSKAMFSVMQSARKKDLPTHVMLDLFKKMVVPVLLHGCEVWGYENLDIIDKFQPNS